MNEMLTDKNIPNIKIGLDCHKPYDCSFLGYCWKDVPNYSVFNISRLSKEKKFSLFHNGVVGIKDLPDNYPLSSNQHLEVQAEKNNSLIIDEYKIKEFVNNLNYPLYFLDFESFQSSIPKFDYSKPFQQIVFQYSLHIQPKPDSELIHLEFLANNNGDPRLPFIERLIQDIGDVGGIVVYNKGFESARLNEIVRDFNKYNDQIEKINSRMVDLMVLFSRKYYYSPKMKGSYSIKDVFPAMVPGFNYNGLNICEGTAVSIAFEKLYTESDNSKIEQTREDLLAYCKMDTLAMVEILKVLMTV